MVTSKLATLQPQVESGLLGPEGESHDGTTGTVFRRMRSLLRSRSIGLLTCTHKLWCRCSCRTLLNLRGISLEKAHAPIRFLSLCCCA